MSNRGPQRYWEDVNEGEELSPIVYNLNYTSFVAGVSGGQDWNLIHHDTQETQKRGYPEIFVHTNQQQGMFSHLLMDFIGDEGWLKRFQVQFRRMNHLGTTATAKGKVTKKYTQDGEHLVDLDVWIENSKEGISSPGSATVRLPARR